MDKLKPEDLLSLEAYHKQRAEFRARVLAHKRLRQVAVGPNLTLYFEDRLTMQYQVQEMLRVERIFESEGVARGARAIQPVDPGRHELEGDPDARVSGRGGAARGAWRSSPASNTVSMSRSRTSAVCSRMPTRTCRAATRQRPRLSTSCASSWTAPCGRSSRPARNSGSASSIRDTRTRSSRRPTSRARSRPISIDLAALSPEHVPQRRQFGTRWLARSARFVSPTSMGRRSATSTLDL